MERKEGNDSWLAAYKLPRAVVVVVEERLRLFSFVVVARTWTNVVGGVQEDAAAQKLGSAARWSITALLWLWLSLLKEKYYLPQLAVA